jgi:hypothetical protein
MEDICHKKEFEIVHLRKEMNKTVARLNTNMKFENSLVILEVFLVSKNHHLTKSVMVMTTVINILMKVQTM